MPPSMRPAPTNMCNSSMKTMMRPAAAWISLSTAFSRSSNSPRNLAPARISVRSSAKTRRSFSPSGTSPAASRCARPSTTAVLPTPGSPISTGLFFVRRASTWIVRRISSSRPMTGSSLPCRASSVRSRAYFFSASQSCSAEGASALRPWRMRSTASAKPAGLTPARLNRPCSGPCAARLANRRSAVTKRSPVLRAASLACCNTAANSGDMKIGCGPSPVAFCNLARRSSAALFSRSGSPPASRTR